MSSSALLVAAEAREFRGLLRRCQEVAPLPRSEEGDWPVDFACSAQFRGQRLVCVANGPGFQLVSRALDAAKHEKIHSVISTGFCGGLDPALAVGDVVEASMVLDLAAGETYSCNSGGSGTVVSLDRVAESAGEKAELRKATQASAVEMEAAVVARFAQERGVPFFCVRAVSDTAGHSFEISLNRLRDAEGRFQKARVVIEALKRPWSRIPGLMALDRNCRVAEERLGEFFANRTFAV